MATVGANGGQNGIFPGVLPATGPLAQQYPDSKLRARHLPAPALQGEVASFSRQAPWVSRCFVRAVCFCRLPGGFRSWLEAGSKLPRGWQTREGLQSPE